ncbi:ATP-dependent DNA helicase PIF1-like [Aphis craccivora]|uniref:ATP-dependent DNA helicase PIF1-like n=1 Tax=Aphis craccivora TaxID=307492 RepID=A0A6G0YH50_APHCR|nr:ATP-dependent DNA helicase PIF1-like [Aphis craccivora]
MKLKAVILKGPAKGEIAFIPRIPMIPSDLSFSFKRLQFPVKVSFAITMTKAQGQTFKYIGVDLRTECFSHGQLYVAFSRTAGDPNHIMILISTGDKTKNLEKLILSRIYLMQFSKFIS